MGGIFEDHAPTYAQLGLAVFPLAVGRKIPAIPKDTGAARAAGWDAPGNGCHDATSDLAQIDRWADVLPNANIGVATGPINDLLGFDVDPRSGGDATLQRLVAKHGPFPNGPLARTRADGQHLWFSGDGLPADFKKGIKPGIDLKWAGGYLVAPPSYVDKEPDGIVGGYEWIRPPLSNRFPALPRWVINQIKKPPAKTYPPSRGGPEPQRVTWLADQVLKNGPSSHNRDNILFWAAQKAVPEIQAGYYTAREAIDALYPTGQQIGQPDYEIRRALRHLFEMVGERR